MENIFNKFGAQLIFRDEKTETSPRLRLITGDFQQFMSELQDFISNYRAYSVRDNVDVVRGKAIPISTSTNRVPMLLHQPMMESEIREFLDHFKVTTMDIYIPSQQNSKVLMKRFKNHPNYTVEIWQIGDASEA